MKLHATGRDLLIKESERLISGSVKIYTCEFTFDESWDGYTVTAVFSTGNRLVNMAVIGGKCDIPTEVLRPNARIRIGIFGTDGERSRPTTYSEWIPVEQGADISGTSAQPPTPSVYEQWLKGLVGGEWAANEEDRQEAEAGRVKAEAGRVEAENARVEAENARVAAEIAREDLETGYVAQARDAASAATSAHGYAIAAQTKAENAKAAAEEYAEAAQAAQKAAEDARDATTAIAGGNFASKTEAQGYANTAESNAKKYTDQKIAAIPTPDVSGQINTHNSSTSAHSDIRSSISSHTGNKSNPHGVTASQVGAPTVAAMNTAISAHNSDDNAHTKIQASVTAAHTMANNAQTTADEAKNALAQIEYDIALAKQTAEQAAQAAADAKSYTDEKIEGLADPSGIAEAHINAHNTDKNAHNSLFNQKLDKLSFEYRKEIAFGEIIKSRIGKFGVNNSLIVVEITAAGYGSHSGKLVIVTNDYAVAKASVYGDADNVVARNIYIKPSSAADPYVEVYYNPVQNSKTIVHLYGHGVSSHSNLFEEVQTIPSAATLEPTNALVENFADKNSVETQLSSHINATSNPHKVTAAQVGAPTIAQMNAAIAAASTGGGGGGGGAGSWKDLGEGVGLVELLEETTLTQTNTTLPQELPLVAGNSYTVTWNGVDYECVAQDLTDMAITAGTIGLGKIMYGDYPFTIAVVPSEGTTITVEDGNIPATVIVKGVGSVIIPILGKYLPKGTPWVEDGAMVALLEKTEATSFTHPSFGKMWGIYKAVDLKVGETYIVNYNGVDYECVCQAAPAGLINDPDAVAMGNFSVVGGTNTGEPFAMLASYTYQEVDIIDLVGSASVTIAIYGEGELAHKLDNRCLDLEWLPAPVGEKVVAAEKTITSADKFPDFTYSMVENGQKLIVYFDGVRYECKVFGGEGIAYAGNLSQFGLGGAEFPFTLQIMSSATGIVCGSGEHIASVCAYEYERIPAHFLAERYAVESLDGDAIREAVKQFDAGNRVFYKGNPVLSACDPDGLEPSLVYAGYDGIRVVQGTGSVARYYDSIMLPEKDLGGYHSGQHLAVYKDDAGGKYYKVSDELVVKSSTPNSDKRFKITVDDNGTLSATEI